MPDNNVYQLPIARQTPFACGIDPDITASGLAIWDRKNKVLTSNVTISFPDFLRWMDGWETDKLFFYLEAGWLNKTANFHTVNLPDRIKNAHPNTIAKYIGGVRERVSKNVGENHAVGKLMHEVLTDKGFGVALIQPRSRKWTPAEYTQFTGGLKTKNQEKIDAARLVVGL